MEIGSGILVPILIAAGAVGFFVLRRLTEVRGPKRPEPSETSLHQDSPPLQGEDRVLITHPLIRRAAERAAAKGGEAAKYLDRDGDRIYFNFGRIEDPVERKNAVELTKGLQSGGQVNMVQVIQLIRRVFNK